MIFTDIYSQTQQHVKVSIFQNGTNKQMSTGITTAVIFIIYFLCNML